MYTGPIQFQKIHLFKIIIVVNEWNFHFDINNINISTISLQKQLLLFYEINIDDNNFFLFFSLPSKLVHYIKKNFVF